MSKKNKMLRRQEATNKTLAAFGQKPFAIGTIDCAQMALFHLRSLGVKIPKHKLKSYSTPLGGRNALKEAYGVKTLTEAADKWLTRISVAQAVLGDLVQMPSYDDQVGIGALGIYLGNNSVAAFEQDQPMLVRGRLKYDEGAPPIAAWRAIP